MSKKKKNGQVTSNQEYKSYQNNYVFLGVLLLSNNDRSQYWLYPKEITKNAKNYLAIKILKWSLNKNREKKSKCVTQVTVQ